MLKRKGIDRVCCVVLALTLLLAGVYTGAAASGLIQGRGTTGYAQRLFDTSYVHTLDIVIDDWDAFLATCAAEEYTACTLVIDGEKFGSVGIRGKGNTSLSSVAQYGNDRYSFKVEFDQYQKGRSYYGLDKLSLNNLIQDKTYLKDYVSYTLMNKMGVPAPLCSFVQINVNGEPWGLYLAVEAVEDGFMARNFGTTDGDLYKPDSLSMGGGRGNGREFDMSEFQENFQSMFNKQSEDAADESGKDGDAAQASDRSAFPGMPGGFDFGDMPEMPEGFDPGDMPEMPGGFDFGAMPEGFDPNAAGETAEDGDDGEASEGGEEETSAAAAWRSRSPGAMGGFGGFGGFGSDDVKLIYTDDEASSYSNIFENAKTDATEADQARLIAALKALNEGEDIESCVDAEEVIRYLVVHSFLVNGDSYTGSMIHNYYLYEEDGVLSMIPWDYNLAFGGFSMGASGDAGSAVNDPIDSPVSGDVSDRPMVAWIFADEEYTELYHQIYAEFIETVFDSGWMDEELDRVTAMIAPYVEADATAFYSYDEFLTAAESLKTFCQLRAESVSGQLDGTVPSTSAGQNADPEALIDASAISLSDMGAFQSGGMPGGFGGGMPGDPASGGAPEGITDAGDAGTTAPDGMTEAATADESAASDGGESDAPAGFSGAPGNFAPGEMPENFDAENLPEDFDFSNMPGNFPSGETPAGFDADNAPAAADEAAPEADATASIPEASADADEAAPDLPDGQTAPESGDAEVAPSAEAASDGGSRGRSGFGGQGMGGQPPSGMPEGGFPGGQAGSSGNDRTALLWLGGSALLLLAALIFAARFRSNR